MRPVRPRKKFLVFGAPRIEDEEIREVVKCLRSAWIGTGPRVARFEADFAAYKGVNQAVAVSSCTAALHLSLLAADIGKGEEVITTPLTFCATVNAIIHAGAKPILADVDPVTMNINPKEIERRITNRTRAIVPVHFAGRPCNMDAICRIVRKYDLKIIEDCAHAIESEYHGQKTGTFGDFGCFSFYVTKNITTAEGGMVLARRKEDASRIKVLALHGMSKDAWKRFSDDGYKHYFVEECGYKYNMTDLQAAIGISQLKRINRWRKRRQEIWDAYNSAFAGLPCIVPSDPDPHTKHSYHLYTVLIDKGRAGLSRDEFLNGMTKHNIGVGVHYLSLPEHPYYRRTFGWKPDDFPNAMRIGRQTVSLPLSGTLSDKDVSDVIRATRRVLRIHG